MIRNTPKAIALGAKLRTARETAGISQRMLAKQLRMDQSVVSRSESGERVPSQGEVAAILDAVGVTGVERDEIVESARDTSGSPWQGTDLPEQPAQLAALLDVEQMTREFVDWSPLVVPGLLQVGSYTRAIMRAAKVPDAEVETRVAVRLGRKDILTRKNPARFTALIGETALRQMIGGPEVVVEQLDHLVAISDRPNVEIRVVTTDTGWHPGLYGPFALLTMDGGMSVVHLENARSAVFVPDEEDVATYQDVVLELLGIALSPEQSTELIRGEAERMARIDDSPVAEVDQQWS
jgi:transcriptional regulator with XRE-family HTH domain